MHESGRMFTYLRKKDSTLLQVTDQVSNLYHQGEACSVRSTWHGKFPELHSVNIEHYVSNFDE